MVEKTQFQIAALPFSNCVALGKLLNLQIFINNGYNITQFAALLGRLEILVK